MENILYDYSPIISRKPFKLPNNARVAVWPILNAEYFDIGLPVPGGRQRTVPDMQAYSGRDYGNRVGIWRIMEELDRYKVKATLSINADICTHYPVIVQECKKRGWEFMGHGKTNSLVLGGLTEAEERQTISDSLAAVTEACGQRPRGWRGTGMSSNMVTPEILAEEGILYMSDWSNDDQPHPIKVKKGNLINLPADNVPDLRFSTYTAAEYFETIKDHFDVLYREGSTQARTFAFCMHTFEMGQPSRIGVLEKMLQYMKGHKDVWLCTGWELAAWYYESYLGIKLPPG